MQSLCKSIENKGKIIAILSLLLAIFVFTFLQACTGAKRIPQNIGSGDGTIVFADKNLEAAVRTAIGKSEGEILKSEVEKITVLTANTRVQRMIDSFMLDPRLKIASLEGLQYFINLEYLNLQGNCITGITPLKGLVKLKELDISCNAIKNIDSLKDLKNLEKLDISWNGIESVNALEGLIALKELCIGGSSVLAPMGVEENKVGDIRALVNLTDLEILDLQGLGVKDITALKNMKHLKKLLLRGNGANDISQLKNLSELQYLDLNGNQIVSVEALSSMKKLEYLYLSGNQITQTGGLKGLKGLKELDLAQNRISNIVPLEAMVELKKLVLQDNQVMDISPIRGLKNLEHLNLTNNQVVNIDALGEMRFLQYLHLYGNKIENIYTLGKLTNLSVLQIGSNPIKDYSPLTYLKNTQISGITFPFFKEPPERGNVPAGLKWNPYTGGYYDASQYEWNVERQQYSDVGQSNKKDPGGSGGGINLPVSDMLPTVELTDKNRYIPDQGVSLVNAKESITKYLVNSGTKGDVGSQIKLEEITCREVWNNDRAQIYRVEVDYAWLHGIAVIQDGKVVCVLEGMPTKSVFAADVDSDGHYEVYSNILMGSGIVSLDIRGYNLVSGIKYGLSKRMQYDLLLFIKDNALWIKEYKYGAPNELNGEPVSIGKLEVRDGKLVLN